MNQRLVIGAQAALRTLRTLRIQLSSSELDISPSNRFQAFWASLKVDKDKHHLLTFDRGDVRLACHPVGPVSGFLNAHSRLVLYAYVRRRA